MSEYIKVCVVDEIPVGEGRAFPVNEQLVAVFNQGEGQFRAIDDACPHQGASLAEGYVEGDQVTCPWHAWRFKLCNGQWADNPRLKVNAYDVKVEDNHVWVNTEAKADDESA